MTLKVQWIDRGLEPKSPPNPEYPNGIDLSMVTDPDAKTCSTRLPYPAKRIGYFVVECDICGLHTAVTTAGRPDDPRSLRVPCKAN